jgi:D-alanyl-D-alanine carboxypeptidase
MKRKILVLTLLLFFLPTEVHGAVPADSGLLWLINTENRLSQDYVPENMKWYGGLKMHSAVVEPYKKMIAAMEAEGLSGLYIQSAYRDFEHQRFLHSTKTNAYVNLGYSEEEAAVYAARSITYPGASEHQSGLALDVTLDGHLRQSFGDTDQGKWLAENCQRFGFVVRYPYDKTEITKIIYEPWHLRYIGVPHAAIMKEENLCLEEYYDFLAENKQYIYWLEDRASYYLIEYWEPDETPVTESEKKASITTVLKQIYPPTEERWE